MGSARGTGWTALMAASVVLAAPTAVAPDSPVAGVAYLCGLALVLAAIVRGARALPAGHRRPWYLLAGVALLWLLGDTVQRAADLMGVPGGGLGFPDVCWLGSYPVEFAAVNALVRAKNLPRAVRRDVQLDVLVVACSAALGAWHLLIAPQLGSDESVVRTVVDVLYPLGDVVIFSLALAVTMVPGSGGGAGALLVGCLGLTLPLDFLIETLPAVLPSLDVRRLDAAFLVVNALLGAAALHPRRARLTEPAATGPGRRLQVWRVGVLGGSLLAANVACTFTRTSGLRLLPDLIATVVLSVTIVARFYRAARAQEEAADALRLLADHDQLTGAANRGLLRRRLGDFLRAGPGLLIYIDLDGFKAVNDDLGHHMGDAVLRAATERLRALVRESDTVARIGGDEFVVLLHGTPPDAGPAIGARVLADLSRPVSIHGCTTRVGASVGVVVFEPAPGGILPEDALGEEILHRGDSAMYHAKRRGGGVEVVRFDVDRMPATAVH